MIQDRLSTTINSAVWAAYGDSLGFITELADSRMLKQRTGEHYITGLRSWKRRIGGNYGADMLLPKGCYSDDTQLRLATSRSISASREFDPETFSKIELPVWLSYALGAGRGSKLAASSLTKKSTRWFSNFYSNKNVRYHSSGGNGAAMRIQPHVWASDSPHDPKSYLLNVLRNSIVTHGHPRALAGAVVHAVSLGQMLETRMPLQLADLSIINSWVSKVPQLLAIDVNIKDFWIPQWEQASGTRIDIAFSQVFEELKVMISLVEAWMENQSDAQNYEGLVKLLNLNDPASVGSGTKTALAATVVSLLASKQNPITVLRHVANALGTDTDSIASMAGALIGTFAKHRPPEEVMDLQYIEYDAGRLYRLSQGSHTDSFSYPGLIDWTPPRTASDSVQIVSGRVIVAGLGEVTPSGEAVQINSSRGDHVYQWMTTLWGQQLLAKRRSDHALGVENANENKNLSSSRGESINDEEAVGNANNQGTKKGDSGMSMESLAGCDSIDDLSNKAISREFDPKIIGSHILKLAESESGVESVIAYAAIIAKARITRARKQNMNTPSAKPAYKP